MKKYNWIGNKIDDDDMKKLYEMKQRSGKKITDMVREAVKEYLDKGGEKL